MLTYIGQHAFAGCKSLEDINIPRGVAKIEPFTFSECSNLQNVTISPGVKKN